MVSKKFEICREVFSWIEFILIVLLVFYAGFLHGWKNKAVEVQQICNDFIEERYLNGTYQAETLQLPYELIQVVQTNTSV